MPGFSARSESSSAATAKSTSATVIGADVQYISRLALATPRIRREFDRPWAADCAVGGTLFGLHQILYFNALKLTTVTNVNLIGALQPVLVLLIAGRLFQERVTAQALVWSTVALAGAATVIVGSTGAPTRSALGDLLAGVNLFAFTAYFLVSKRIRSRTGPWEYVTGMTTVAGVVMGAACLVSRQDLGSPAGWEWAVLAGLAILPGTLGHLLTNWAHAHVSALVVSLMLLAVPALAAGLAAVILGEHVTPVQIVGGAVVLGAIAVVVRSARRAGPAMAESAAATDAP